MGTLKRLNKVGLILLVGSTIISLFILYPVAYIKIFISAYFNGFANPQFSIGSLDYILINLSFMILGLILIIHDLKN